MLATGTYGKSDCNQRMKLSKLGILTIIGPGILVAATGVGAGDLATGAFAGGRLGVAILWAVLVGALLKFVINEGLARWQLVTGETLVEGAISRCGSVARWFFLAYLALWSFLVGAALMSACGVAGHAIFQIQDASTDKIIYGIGHSLAALLLVRLGGYRLFEKVMACCIGLMFVVVVMTAVALQPPWADVLRGLFVPTIPNFQATDIQWTIALIGGVGGTLTVLCYGYWIREEGRQGIDWIVPCRIDLAVAYGMTALFGIAMVIIGNELGDIDNKKGASLVVMIADRLEQVLGAAGPTARVAFLIGSWGAFFSSLLGVWQSVPYLFADVWSQIRETPTRDRPVVDQRAWPYQMYLFAIATLPAIGLFIDFKQIQKLYAFVGALCIPLLAVVLLYLNGRTALVGRFRNSWLTQILLAGALVFFVIVGTMSVWK